MYDRQLGHAVMGMVATRTGQGSRHAQHRIGFDGALAVRGEGQRQSPALHGARVAGVLAACGRRASGGPQHQVRLQRRLPRLQCG
jgi:hypothetical protein